MNVSKANVALEVTNPLVKEKLDQSIVEACGAISGMMKWKHPNDEALLQDQVWCGGVVWSDRPRILLIALKYPNFSP